MLQSDSESADGSNPNREGRASDHEAVFARGQGCCFWDGLAKSITALRTRAGIGQSQTVTGQALDQAPAAAEDGIGEVAAKIVKCMNTKRPTTSQRLNQEFQASSPGSLMPTPANSSDRAASAILGPTFPWTTCLCRPVSAPEPSLHAA